ncbi:MAG: hypothetical protein HY289_12875 [Planctomycetes bacterium]|nr:hypothetical protein [Planctomycetota bacterium]
MRNPRFALILVLLAPCPVATVRAAMMYVYDLDSLVHLSTDVAEAEITRSFKADTIDLIEAKVTLVHKGGFKKGQIIAVVDADYYRKPAIDKINNEKLAVGDRIVLFAVRAKPSDFNRIPENAVLYAPLPGGMRLVHGDQIHGFAQRDNPGPYVAYPQTEKKKPFTLESFRKKVETSLRDTKEWAKLIEAKTDQLDVPALLKLLGDRSKVSYGGRDYFTERTCMRFAETHDPVVLSKALAVAKAYYDVSILQRGFGSPKGRDYLLTKIDDAKEPMPVRLRYARALGEAGSVYREVFTDIGSNGWRHVGKVDEGNSGYLTRIAKSVRANARHEELARSLIRCLDYSGQGISQNKPEPLMVDLSGANAVLKELYDAKPSQEMQFAIEKATVWIPNDYAKLKSPCGPMVSILRWADPQIYTKPEKPSLIFEYEYTTVLMGRNAEVTPSVVLLHEKTQKRHALPTTLRIRGWATGGGSNSVELPKDLPRGRYHVFLELRDGEQVISVGHHFAIEL